jgi:molybdenum cofactor cytidylyltransferase
MSIVQSGKIPTGIILLAAGGSSRLGQPKQLLEFKGKTLLEHSIQAALMSAAQPVVVVLGANADLVKKQLKEKNQVHTVVNTEWQAGMASSIQCGVKAFTDICPFAEGVILMVCDQPFVTPALLNELVEAHKKTGKPIIACSYENTFGPPVFFHHSLFPALLQLKGDVGARGVIRQYADDVDVIPFPQGSVDVDTEADYEKIKTQAGNR